MNYKKNWLFVGQGAGFQAVECDTGIFQALEELGFVPEKAIASSGSALFCSLYYSGFNIKRMICLEQETSPFDWVELVPWQALKTAIGKSNYCLDNSKIQQLLLEEMTFDATERVQVSVTRMDDYSTHLKPATPDWTLAATSIPFVFKTLKKDGFYWGDGGILNNVPLPSLEDCKRYERIILFLAPKTDYNGKELGLKGIAQLLLTVMMREEIQLKEAGYLNLPNLTLIRPKSAHGGNLFKWSNNFKLREECKKLTLEALKNEKNRSTVRRIDCDSFFSRMREFLRF